MIKNPMQKNYSLTKTTFVYGTQCLKRLYLEIKHPELKRSVTPEERTRMDVGIEVGKIARTLFPKGILIQERGNQALERTSKETENAVSLFEATFLYDEVLVRVDILNRKKAGEAWQLIEVKSSTKLKDEHLPDLAVQLYVLEKAGIKVSSIHLMRINNKAKSSQPEDLLEIDDVSEEIRGYLPLVPELILEMKKNLKGEMVPSVLIGKQCSFPYDCPFKNDCWKDVPSLSVLDLYRESVTKRFELFHAGIVEITHPKVSPKHELAQRMVAVERTGKRFIDSKGIKEKISGWQLPFYHLDFETMAPAIPRFKSSLPYQKIPIQFSCHIQKKIGGKAEQIEYLHLGINDPREAMAKALCEAIEDKGSVLAFNAGFEERVLKDLAALVPKYADKLLSIAERLVDPQDVFREYVYDSGFLGTFSLKTVAPAILGKEYDYENLEVQSGDLVAVLYDEMNSPATSDERRAAIQKSVLEYCRQDTLAMAKLVDWLFAQAK